MKLKWTTSLLSIILLFAVAGCGGQSGSSDSASGGSAYSDLSQSDVSSDSLSDGDSSEGSDDSEGAANGSDSASNGSDGSSDASASESGSSGGGLPEPAQLIYDNYYKTGFNVNKQADGVAGSIGELVYSDEQLGTEHAWDFCQWNSGYYHKENGNFPDSFNMIYAEKTVLNGTYTWKDRAGSKTFSVNPDTGTVYMEMNGSAEYPYARPADGGFMTYVLNFGLDPEANLSVSDMSTLYLEFEYTLEKFEEADYADDQAQFVIYFILRNVNKNSADYGKYMWFGLYPYDNRYNFAPTHAEFDTNTTDGFIYGIGGAEYLTAKPQTGRLTYIFTDLLPYVSTALETAQAKGALANTTLGDIDIEGGNYGWEIGGAFDVGMTVSMFNLYTEYKVQ